MASRGLGWGALASGCECQGNLGGYEVIPPGYSSTLTPEEM